MYNKNELKIITKIYKVLWDKKGAEGMNRLIKAELYRLSKLAGYKILLLGSLGIALAEGIFIVAYGTSTGANPTMGGYTALKTYLVWPLFAALMTGMYTAVFLCSEFGSRTYGLNLLCGLSRGKVFLSKMAVFYAGLLPIFYFHMIVVSSMVTLAFGFGGLTAGVAVETLKMVIYSLLGYLVLGGYYALLAVWLKNPIATVGVGFTGAFMQMNLKSRLTGVDAPLLKLSFMYQLDQFLNWDTFQDGIYLLVMTATFLLVFSAALILYVRSDLK